MKSFGSFRKCPRFIRGSTTKRMYVTATMPASAGVKIPLTTPPTMMIGIISGRIAARVAPAISPNVARCFRIPGGPKK